jgi:hypothetical protein
MGKYIDVSDTGIIDITDASGGSTGTTLFTFKPDGTTTNTTDSVRVYDPASRYIEIKVYSTTGSVKTGDIGQDI